MVNKTKHGLCRKIDKPVHQPEKGISGTSSLASTNVCHNVTVAVLVGRITGPFQVDHHLFPAIPVRRNSRNHFLFRRHLPKTYASQASVGPLR